MKPINFSKANSLLFLRTFRLLFSISVKSKKNFIFVIFIPVFFTLFILYFYNTYLTKYTLLPPQITSFLYFGPIFCGMYFSLIFSEWKRTYILKRMKFVGIKKWYILLVIILISGFFSLISSLSQLLTMFVASHFLKSINFKDLNNLLFWNWIIIIFLVILISTFCILFFLSFDNLVFMNKKWIGYLLTFGFFLVFVFFSDTALVSFITSRNVNLVYFSYLIPIKYLVWVSMLTTSFTFLEKDGIQQIINDIAFSNTTVFTYSIWICLLVALTSIVVLFIINIWKFKWKEN